MRANDSQSKRTTRQAARAEREFQDRVMVHADRLRDACRAGQVTFSQIEERSAEYQRTGHQTTAPFENLDGAACLQIVRHLLLTDTSEYIS